MKKIFLVLTCLISFYGVTYSQPTITPVFPQIGSENISLWPKILLQTDYPIDTTGIFQDSLFIPFDTNGIRLSPVLLYDNFYVQNSFPDSLLQKVGVPCFIKLLTANTIEVTPITSLKYESTYSFKVLEKLKVIIRDPIDSNIISKVPVSLDLIPYFKTIERPLKIAATTIDSSESRIMCSQDIVVRFNKSIPFSQNQLDSAFSIKKVGNKIEDSTDGSHYYEFENVPISIQLGNDSSYAVINPTLDLELGSTNFLVANISNITGDDRSNIEQRFVVPRYSIIKVTPQSLIQGDTLPPNLFDINGYSDWCLYPGDSAILSVPPVSGEFSFKDWVIPHMDQSVVVYGNTIKLKPSCNNLYDRRIIALYERIPLDTVKIDTLKYFNGINYAKDTCSKIKVFGYQDSINRYLYTYKRYSEDNLRFTIELCENINFENWTSSDSTIDGENLSYCSITRNPGDDRVPSFGIGPRTISIGGNINTSNETCDTSTIWVVAQMYIDGKHAPNFNMSGQLFVGGFINIDGRPVPLLPDPDPNRTSTTIKIPGTGRDINVNGLIADPHYEIAYYQLNGVLIGNADKYDFANRVGNSFNVNLRVDRNKSNCSDGLLLWIRRKVVNIKYEVEMNDPSVKRVPSKSIAGPIFNPEPPSTINQLLNSSAPNGTFESMYYYTYPERLMGTDDEGYAIVLKQTYSVYYYWDNLADLRITPHVEQNCGFKFKEWYSDLAGEYTTGPLESSTSTTLKIKLYKNHKVDQLLSTSFMLDYIACYKTRNFEPGTPEDEGAPPKDPVEWVKYSPESSNGQGYDIMSDDDIDKGIGLLSDPFYHPENVSQFHKRIPIFKFAFSKEVDITTLPGNLWIDDGAIHLKSGPSAKRLDGVKYQTYELWKLWVEKDGKKEAFSNYSVSSDRVGVNNNVVEVSGRTKPWLKLDELGNIVYNAEGYPVFLENWMSHINRFTIFIQNYEGQNNRIKSASGEVLTNCKTETSNSLVSFKGITSLPGISIKSARHCNCSDNDDGWGRGDPDVVIHTFVAVKDQPTSIKTTEKNWEHDSEGRITYKISSLRIPSSGVWEAMVQGTIRYYNAPIITIDQLKEGDNINILFTWIDDNDSKVSNDIIDIFQKIGELLLNDNKLGLNKKDEPGSSEKGNYDLKACADVAKKLLNLLSSSNDRVMGNVNFYLSYADKGLNYDPELNSRNWDYWGAEKYKLYEPYELTCDDDSWEDRPDGWILRGNLNSSIIVIMGDIR